MLNVAKWTITQSKSKSLPLRIMANVQPINTSANCHKGDELCPESLKIDYKTERSSACELELQQFSPGRDAYLLKEHSSVLRSETKRGRERHKLEP